MRRQLAKGSRKNKQGSGGWTPLYLAAATGQVEAVEVLLKWNVDVDGLSDTRGPYAIPITAIEIAAEGKSDRHYKIFKLLRQRGAQRHIDKALSVLKEKNASTVRHCWRNKVRTWSKVRAMVFRWHEAACHEAMATDGYLARADSASYTAEF
jgi:ankyrin repeat protein